MITYQKIMQPSYSFTTYSLNNNKNIPISSFATEWEVSKSRQQFNDTTYKQQSQPQNQTQPRFLTLINKTAKTQFYDYQQPNTQKRDYNESCFSILENMCKCVEVQQDEICEKLSKPLASSRVDLSHLNTKKNQIGLIHMQKASLTPISSLVNLLPQQNNK